MRAVGVHADAVVVTSRLWQTTATAIRAPGGAGGEAILIDSPYFPDELDVLPELLRQAGFEVAGLLATHADFDHLLGRLAFPGATVGLAESSAARLRAEPGVAQRELRDADAEHYVARSAPLSLGGTQALPVPGYVGLGDEEVELHPAEGHTSNGMALFVQSARVLVCGDYLSDVEIPVIGAGGSLGEYRATLARLGGLVESSETIVPGHGSPQDRDGALRILDADVEYLDALERGDEPPALPPGRDTVRQRAIHAANLAAMG